MSEDARENPELVRINAEAHHAAVLEMRVAGWTPEQIAKSLGVSRRRVRNILSAQLERARRRTNETADELLQLELKRLDRYLKSLEDRIDRGDVKAVEAALKVSERRARLAGLDAPDKSEVKVSVEHFTDEELIEEARRQGLALTVIEGNLAAASPPLALRAPLPGEAVSPDPDVPGPEGSGGVAGSAGSPPPPSHLGPP